MSEDGTRVPGPGLAQRIFAGQGEMAALIRNRDWTTTPLGPVESWPQSLRTAVSICLGSRHPIVLWWGPERWMFYNDAYRPMLGQRKHPQYLGASGQACWSEIWDVIGPMMDQVLETGEPTWSENLMLLMLRHGYLEETYFTFSYSPILDESGRPSGIFNACSETTARVLSERRMQALHAMAVDARSVQEAAQRCAQVLAQNARDVPFALIYLSDRSGDHWDLCATAGLAAGTQASPVNVAMNAASGGWPLKEVTSTGIALLVDRLSEQFDGLPTAPWDESASQAMVLPIPRPGSSTAAGALVLGISPRRAFDDDYRRFFELVGTQVATAVANARAHEEQHDRAEKLAQLDRAKTAFFNNVSHEFRTPLTLILGPVEDALAGPAGTLQGAALESVHHSAVRLLRLVNSLLDFSRIEAGRLTSAFEPTDLAMLTGGLAGSFQSLVESAGLQLVVACAPIGEPVYVDRSQWEKIVLNLISNAFKFTFEGRIVVSLHPGDGEAVLTVTDTGTGIPPSELPRIFERFHRVEGARGRSFEGTGIGLALVQELVKQHGGSIHARSQPGRGSTFTVSVPLGTAHLPPEQIRASDNLSLGRSATADMLEASQWLHARSQNTRDTTQPEAAEDRQIPRQERARLLVADDNADMREYLVRLLSPHWDVEAVGDGEAALASALRDPPDLVLSDVMMPLMDGVALLRALRDDPRTATIPFVLLSARAGEEAIVGGLQTGADDYLVKPFSARELIGRVATHLELARMRRAAAEVARELADTRAALLRDLERKNQELEAFSYSVSHDLRGPLRAIDGFSRILLEDYAQELPEDAQHCVQRVCDGASRMNELISDLLDLSRVSQGELAHEVVDMSAIVRKVVSRLVQHDPDRPIRVDVAEGLVVRADGRLLEIAWENLVGNAWKFTARRSDAHVEVGVERHDGRDVFFIRDNGAGFDMAQAEKLFTPFKRLHSDQEFHGTGIGLTTVHRVIARHGGSIWATAAVDEGTTVYFTLGRQSAQLDEPPVEEVARVEVN